MEMLLQRDASTSQSTPGTLSIDGAFECFTLEDVVREIPGRPVAEWKIKDKTAIPVGTYDVIVDFSDHFHQTMPHLLNVPGFDGIRIHSGNTAADTEGCILVGRQRTGPDFVAGSRDAYGVLLPKIQGALARGEKVRITVAAARQAAQASTG